MHDSSKAPALAESGLGESTVELEITDGDVIEAFREGVTEEVRMRGLMASLKC